MEESTPLTSVRIRFTRANTAEIPSTRGSGFTRRPASYNGKPNKIKTQTEPKRTSLASPNSPAEPYRFLLISNIPKDKKLPTCSLSLIKSSSTLTKRPVSPLIRKSSTYLESKRSAFGPGSWTHKGLLTNEFSL